MNLFFVLCLFFITLIQTAEFLDSQPPHRQIKPPNVAPANPFDPMGRSAEGGISPDELRMYSKSPKGSSNILDPGKRKQTQVGRDKKEYQEEAVGSGLDDIWKIINTEFEDGADAKTRSDAEKTSSTHDNSENEEPEESSLAQFFSSNSAKKEAPRPSAKLKLTDLTDWLKDLDLKIKGQLKDDPSAASGVSDKIKEAKAWKPVHLEDSLDVTKEFNKNFKKLSKKHALSLDSRIKRDEPVPVTPPKEKPDKSQTASSGSKKKDKNASKKDKKAKKSKDSDQKKKKKSLKKESNAKQTSEKQEKPKKSEEISNQKKKKIEELRQIEQNEEREKKENAEAKEKAETETTGKVKEDDATSKEPAKKDDAASKEPKEVIKKPVETTKAAEYQTTGKVEEAKKSDEPTKKDDAAEKTEKPTENTSAAKPVETTKAAENKTTGKVEEAKKSDEPTKDDTAEKTEKPPETTSAAKGVVEPTKFVEKTKETSKQEATKPAKSEDEKARAKSIGPAVAPFVRAGKWYHGEKLKATIDDNAILEFAPSSHGSYPIQQVGPNKIFVDVHGHPFNAEVENGGRKLMWDDGEIWVHEDALNKKTETTTEAKKAKEEAQTTAVKAETTGEAKKEPESTATTTSGAKLEVETTAEAKKEPASTAKVKEKVETTSEIAATTTFKAETTAEAQKQTESTAAAKVEVETTSEATHKAETSTEAPKEPQSTAKVKAEVIATSEAAATATVKAETTAKAQKQTESTAAAKVEVENSTEAPKEPQSTAKKAETSSKAKEKTAETTALAMETTSESVESTTENDEAKKTATTVELKCEGDYKDVVGSKKEKFVEECSAYFAPSRCTDVWSGSVVIALKADSPTALQSALEKASKGIKLPGFPALTVSKVEYPKVETTTTTTVESSAQPTGDVPIVPTNKYSIEVIGLPSTTEGAVTTTTTKDIESKNENTMPPLDVVTSDDKPAALAAFGPLPDNADLQAALQKQWTHFKCKEGPGQLCHTCMSEYLITETNQCDSCNLGYALVDGKCMPMQCETGMESRCKTCAPQEKRKYHHYCADCNEGYRLVDGSCVVAQVTLTEANMQKWDAKLFNGKPKAVNYTVNDVVKKISKLEPPDAPDKFIGSGIWTPVSKNVNSKLINGPQIRQIEKWIGIKDQTWELCYRKSGHGGNAFTFHKLCGGKGPTITIIKLHTGKLIGMYASLAWGPLTEAYSMTNQYRMDESAFLFSLTNNFKHGLAGKTQYSIFDYHYFGPTFGGGFDVQVGFNMTTVTCRLGFSYECRTGEALSKECIADFCGLATSNIADIEVHFLSGPRTIGSILISQASKDRLERWAEGDRMEWRLCYRKSRDKGDHKMFLKKCAGRGATFTVARLSSGRVVGGFTRQSWGGECYQKDSASFLFRLPSVELSTSYKHKQLRDELHICGGEFAPRFGGGHDLLINNKLAGGSCNLGYTYKCAGDLEYGSKECHENFCGGYQGWKIQELEVWTVRGPLSAESKYLMPDMVAKLNEWVGIPQMRFRTCFRKSDQVLNEMSKCKSVVGPSVTLFLLSNGRLIGAYSSITPKMGTGFRFDSTAFLFSLEVDTHFNVTGKDWKYIQIGASHHDSSKAVLDSPKRSYAYGGGDFSLNGDLKNGVCNLGYTYKCRVGNYQSDACLRDFCGEFNVSVVDVEQMKVQCKPGFTLSGTSCQHFTCQVGKGDACATCAALSDRRHNNHCGSCNPGFALAYGSCIAYTCETGKGQKCKTCVEPDKRKRNNHCQACNKGYLVHGDLCAPHACDQWPGTASCRTCIPLEDRWKSNQCATCWPGFHLNSMKCVPYTCDTKEQMDSCASCVPQILRVKDNDCKTCNPGFGVKDGDCIPLDCQTGSGDACLECLPQANRTIENHCAKCNPGRFLTEGTCKMYDCASGPRDACKTCVDPEDRTADGQCIECNEGYVLGTDKTCIPLPCKTGKDGSSCYECADPESRIVENQCASCHPGYYLKKDTMSCAPYTCGEEEANCSKCLSQETRTDHNQCEQDSCKEGYVWNNGICTGIPCATTTLVGKGCKICAGESERKHVNHCSGCHDGFDLWEGYCVVYCDPKDNKWNCCSKAKPCGPESGDCDKDSDCAGDLKCVQDVGKEFDAYQSMDICLPSEGKNDDRNVTGKSEIVKRQESLVGVNNSNDLDVIQYSRWKYRLSFLLIGCVLLFFCASFRERKRKPETRWLLDFED